MRGPERQEPPTPMSSSYTGKAGELAVMAELAWRGYNVAMPEIDEGDDIFSLHPGTGQLKRIQVKTADPTTEGHIARYQFRIKKTAITTPIDPDRNFVVALRSGSNWRYLIIERTVLNDLSNRGKLGAQAGDYLTIFITEDTQNQTLKGPFDEDWKHHLGKWDQVWPEVA